MAPNGFDWALVLEHVTVDVITYVHEWPFSMLQDAASLTLKLLRAAIDEDMTSKDATPYNIQFVGAKPTFIDIASFETYRTGEPWWGYRQFCQMFLYPLMLTAYKDLPHQPWMRGAVDGITPEQARRVLQGRRHSSKGLIPHVWLHAKADRRFPRGICGHRQRLETSRIQQEDLRCAGRSAPQTSRQLELESFRF